MSTGQSYSLSYAFKQQVMHAWQPIPSLTSAFFIFLFIGFLFGGAGGAIFYFSSEVFSQRIQYDAICKGKNKCEVTLDVVNDLEAPVFVYYELGGIYQNHRRYIGSKSIQQLKGNYMDADELGFCNPVILNKDLHVKYSIGGVELDPNKPAYPCGLVARSIFNDTFELFKGNSQIPISSENIAWDDDLDRYKNLEEKADELQWLDVESERFMVWMRTAALPDFRKLWGRIEQPIKKGTYTLKIENSKPIRKKLIVGI